MNRAEFIEKSESLKKNSNRAGKWFLVYLAVFVLFVVWLNKNGNTFLEEVLVPILPIILVGGLISIAFFFGHLAQKQRRELGLCCPHCKKDLIGISFQIVVASGRCGRCGGIVLEDWNR